MSNEIYLLSVREWTLRWRSHWLRTLGWSRALGPKSCPSLSSTLSVESIFLLERLQGFFLLFSPISVPPAINLRSTITCWKKIILEPVESGWWFSWYAASQGEEAYRWERDQNHLCRQCWRHNFCHQYFHESDVLQININISIKIKSTKVHK